LYLYYKLFKYLISNRFDIFNKREYLNNNNNIVVGLWEEVKRCCSGIGG